RCAELAQQARHRGDIDEVRHIGERQRIRRQECGRHQRQRRVLGAADPDLATKPTTAAYAYPVHAMRLLTEVPGEPMTAPRSAWPFSRPGELNDYRHRLWLSCDIVSYRVNRFRPRFHRFLL